MRNQHADLQTSSELRRLAKTEERKKLEMENAQMLEEELERMRMEVDHHKAEIQVSSPTRTRSCCIRIPSDLT